MKFSLGTSLGIVSLYFLGLSQTNAQSATTAWSSTATHAYDSRGATVGGPALGTESVPIVVTLQLQNLVQLQGVALGVASGSALPITHDAFMSTFAPTEAQAQLVTSYLADMGYSDIVVDDNRLLVSASGTSAMAAAAFNTSFAYFTRNGTTGYANVADAQVPSTLANVVLAVLGLETVESTNTAIGSVQTAGSPPPPSGLQFYDPTAFPLIYSANTLPSASTQSIGIVSEGKLTQVLMDLDQFEVANGLPVLSPTVVNVGTPSSDMSNDDEWDLDSQTLQSMAGGSLGSLTFYVAPSLSDSNLTAVYSKIVSLDTAKIINVSLLECEATAYNNGSLAADDQIFVSAVAQGQVFFVASGDSGSRECGGAFEVYGTSPSVSYPASSPYVVAVGGTTLETNANGTWASETAWSYSGGGASAYESAPQWTQGITSVPPSPRVIPDIAMDANPSSGVNIVVNGVYSTTVGYGGTSLAAPLAGGAWARVEQAQSSRFGFPDPLIYSQTVPISSFHDITSGSNDDYSAGTYWDYTTGWGSLIASTLSTNLAALPTAAPTSVSDTGAGKACPSDHIVWSSVTGATSYQLYYKIVLPTGTPLFEYVTTDTGLSQEVTLSKGDEFIYAVKACDAAGCSQLSTSQKTVSYGTCN